MEIDDVESALVENVLDLPPIEYRTADLLSEQSRQGAESTLETYHLDAVGFIYDCGCIALAQQKVGIDVLNDRDVMALTYQRAR